MARVSLDICDLGLGAGLMLEAWPAQSETARRPDGRAGPGLPGDRKVGCLFNVYLLTVNPHLALGESTADRHRLFALHAVLIDPGSGRIAATYHSLPGDPDAPAPWAAPAADLHALSNETPAAPGITTEQLIAFWRRRDVDEARRSSSSCSSLAGLPKSHHLWWWILNLSWRMG